MSSSAWNPSEGEYGFLGSAAGSQARIGKDLGFAEGGHYESWKGDRQGEEDKVRDVLIPLEEDIVFDEDSPYLYKSQRDDSIKAQGAYEDAVAAFDFAKSEADIAEGKYGSFDAETWEDLSDEEKGTFFEEAGSTLESAELTKARDITDLEGTRGSIGGQAITEEQAAQQARMQSGLEYSGTLEKNIAASKGALESEMFGTQVAEMGIMDRWNTAQENYETDLQIIEEEWNRAKGVWQRAYDEMYAPETGALAQYQTEMADIESEAKTSFYTDFEGGGKLENLKEGYIDFWTLGGTKGGGRSSAEELWETRGYSSGYSVESDWQSFGSGDGSLDDWGARTTRSGNLAAGYGGHSHKYDIIVDRFASFESELGGMGDYYDEEGDG